MPDGHTERRRRAAQEAAHSRRSVAGAAATEVPFRVATSLGYVVVRCVVLCAPALLGTPIWARRGPVSACRCSRASCPPRTGRSGGSVGGRSHEPRSVG